MSGVVFRGVVAKKSSDKTVMVLVEKGFLHPVCKKIIRQKKKILAHDEKNSAKLGDVVSIEESRPYSKRKFFKVVEGSLKAS